MTNLLFIGLSAEHYVSIPRPRDGHGGRVAVTLTTFFGFRFERKRYGE